MLNFEPVPATKQYFNTFELNFYIIKKMYKKIELRKSLTRRKKNIIRKELIGYQMMSFVNKLADSFQGLSRYSTLDQCYTCLPNVVKLIFANKYKILGPDFD